MTAETAPTTRTGIDPRGPRFGAAITGVLLLAEFVLLVSGATIASAVLLIAIVAVFAWGAFAGVARHPYGAVYRATLRRRLGAPTELEDPRPPTFAQLVGFVITGIGLVVLLVGFPVGAAVFVALAFVAAFLNAVFDFCLGCQMYLIGTRVLARS